MVQVKEYWYREMEDVYHVYSDETLVKYNRKEYEESKEQILAITEESNIIKIKSMVVKYAVTVNDQILLYDGYSPYGDNYIPIVPFIGFCDMSAKKLKKKFFGLIESLKDVQRDKNRNKINRRYAQNATLHSGWFNTKGAVDDTRPLQIGMGMQIVNVNPGHNDPRRIPLPNYPQYLFSEENKNDQDRMTIGLNADALGLGATSNDSSKAVSLRQQTGITAVAEIPANYSIALKTLARICLDMVMLNITPKKVQRIVGSDYEVTEELFNKLTERDFDITIDEATFNPTHKMQMLGQLAEYMQYSGQPIPLEMYLKFTEIDPELRDMFVQQQQTQMQQQAAMQQQGAGQPQGQQPIQESPPPEGQVM